MSVALCILCISVLCGSLDVEHIGHICPVVSAHNSNPEADTDVTMQDNPSYSAVQGGLVMQANPAYEQSSGE